MVLEVAAGSTSKTNQAVAWQRGAKVVTCLCLAHREFDRNMTAKGNRMLAFLPEHPGA